MTDVRTVRRWGGAATVATIVLALGVGTLNTSVFVAAIPPAVFVLYSVATGVREPQFSLAVSRTVEPEKPQPGSDVTVTLTVENETDKALPDVRIADGVPSELVVTSGSPRAALALSPQQSETVTYTVAARRGRYEFEDPTVRTRSLAASTSATESVPAAGDRELDASFTVGSVGLANRTMPFAGTISVDTAGAGVEFHSTREYEPGDAVSRINWRGFAKRDELSTVDYHVQNLVEAGHGRRYLGGLRGGWCG